MFLDVNVVADVTVCLDSFAKTVNVLKIRTLMRLSVIYQRATALINAQSTQIVQKTSIVTDSKESVSLYVLAFVETTLNVAMLTTIQFVLVSKASMGTRT